MDKNVRPTQQAASNQDPDIPDVDVDTARRLEGIRDKRNLQSPPSASSLAAGAGGVRLERWTGGFSIFSDDLEAKLAAEKARNRYKKKKVKWTILRRDWSLALQHRKHNAREGWAIRHCNPNWKDSQLSHLELDFPWMPMSPKDQRLLVRIHPAKWFGFIKEYNNTHEPSQRLSNEQSKRFIDLHTMMNASHILRESNRPVRLRSPREWKRIVDNTTKQLAESLLSLKDGQRVPLSSLDGEIHMVGLCIRKLPMAGENCRMEIECFNGHAHKSKQGIISFPQSMLTTEKGLKALAGFFSSSKTIDSRLDKFLLDVNGNTEQPAADGRQTEPQRMGNCLVHNPQCAFVEAVKSDPILGPEIAKSLLSYLDKRATRIIKNSRMLSPDEKKNILSVPQSRHQKTPSEPSVSQSQSRWSTLSRMLPGNRQPRGNDGKSLGIDRGR